MMIGPHANRAHSCFSHFENVYSLFSAWDVLAWSNTSSRGTRTQYCDPDWHPGSTVCPQPRNTASPWTSGEASCMQVRHPLAAESLPSGNPFQGSIQCRDLSYDPNFLVFFVDLSTRIWLLRDGKPWLLLPQTVVPEPGHRFRTCAVSPLG